MVEVVTPENKTLYTSLLEDMYEMRYRIFVEGLKWKIPGITAGRDKDDFDTEQSIYLLALSDDRSRVIGSTRLNPTTAPHMMSEVFSHYCDLQPIPRSPRILECSRYAIDPVLCGSKEKFTDVRQHLGLALTEYIMSINATHISWLTHQNFYNHTIRVMDTMPLGMPREEPSDKAIYVAGLSRLNEATWHRQRKNLERPIEDITEFRTEQTRYFLTPRFLNDDMRRVA